MRLERAIVVVLLGAALSALADDANEKHQQDQARRFHEALREKQQEIEHLKGAVAKLRAQAEMCEDRAKAASAAPAAKS